MSGEEWIRCHAGGGVGFGHWLDSNVGVVVAGVGVMVVVVGGGGGGGWWWW